VNQSSSGHIFIVFLEQTLIRLAYNNKPEATFVDPKPFDTQCGGLVAQLMSFQGAGGLLSMLPSPKGSSAPKGSPKANGPKLINIL
jgi:hypothetical protein